MALAAPEPIDRRSSSSADPAAERDALVDSQRGLLFALGMATFMVSLDGRVVAPLLPRIAQEFGLSVATAGYLVSGYLVPYGLFQLAYGPFADRFGKVRVSAFAMIAFSLGTALCGAFSSFGALLLARIFTGAAAAALIPLTIAYIGDVVPYGRRQSALGMLMASSGAAQAVGTSVGGLIAAVLAWRSVFPLLGGLAGAVTLWLFRQLPHELRPPRPALAPRYRDALRSRLLPLLVLVFFEGGLFLGVYPYLSGLLEQRFGLDSLSIGLVLAIGGASQMLAARLLQPLLRRLSEPGMVALGGSCMALAYAISALGTSVPWVGVGTGLIGAGFSICHSTLQTRATEAFPSGRGTSLALFAFSLFLGGGVGSLGMGALLDGLGYESAFGIAAAGFAAFTAFASKVVSQRLQAPSFELNGAGAALAAPGRGTSEPTSG